MHVRYLLGGAVGMSRSDRTYPENAKTLIEIVFAWQGVAAGSDVLEGDKWISSLTEIQRAIIDNDRGAPGVSGSGLLRQE